MLCIPIPPHPPQASRQQQRPYLASRNNIQFNHPPSYRYEHFDDRNLHLQTQRFHNNIRCNATTNITHSNHTIAQSKPIYVTNSTTPMKINPTPSPPVANDIISTHSIYNIRNSDIDINHYHPKYQSQPQARDDDDYVDIDILSKKMTTSVLLNWE